MADDPYNRFEESVSAYSILPKIRQLENSGDDAVSPAGAIGQYQIMPDTARRLGYDPQYLKQPQYNEMVAKANFDDLHKQWGNDPETIVAAWNTNPAHVHKWLNAGRDDSVLLPETQKYLAHYRLLNEPDPYAQFDKPQTQDDPYKQFLGSKAEAQPQHQPVGMPSPVSAIIQGITQAGEEAKSTVGTLQGKGPAAAQQTSPAAADLAWGDVRHPIAQLLPKLAYQLGHSAPVLGGGIAGGLLGAAIPGAGETGIPEVAGGALGAALGDGVQTLGPMFKQRLAETPKDPNGAWDRTMRDVGIEAAATGVGWAMFGLKGFENPLKQAMFQAFGVQPGVSVGTQALENISHGQPAEQNLGSAYAQGVAGTLPFAVGHAAVSALRPRGRTTSGTEEDALDTLKGIVGEGPPDGPGGPSGGGRGPDGPGGPRQLPPPPYKYGEGFVAGAPPRDPNSIDEYEISTPKYDRPGMVKAAADAKAASDDIQRLDPDGSWRTVHPQVWPQELQEAHGRYRQAAADFIKAAGKQVPVEGEYSPVPNYPRLGAPDYVQDPLLYHAQGDIERMAQPPTTPKNPNIIDEIMGLGGIKIRGPDGEITKEGSEIKALLKDYRRPGLIDNRAQQSSLQGGGLPPDTIRELLRERGWFGPREDQGADIQDLYDAINQTANGRPYFHPDSEGAAEQAYRDKTERDMTEAGIGAKDKPDVAAHKLADWRRSQMYEPGESLEPAFQKTKQQEMDLGPEETPAERKARLGRAKIAESQQLPRAVPKKPQQPANEGLFAEKPEKPLLQKGDGEDTANPAERTYLQPNLSAEVLKDKLPPFAQWVARELNRLAPNAQKVPVRNMTWTGDGDPVSVFGSYLRDHKLGDPRPAIAWAVDGERGLGGLGAARHEAIHYLRRQGLITPHEWSILADAAKSQDWAGKYEIGKRYPELDADRQTEEAVAESFARWRQSEAALRGEIPPLAARAFRRVAQFFGRVKDAFNRSFGQSAGWEDVFGRVDRGDVGARATPGIEPSAVDEMALEKSKGYNAALIREAKAAGYDPANLAELRRFERLRKASTDIKATTDRAARRDQNTIDMLRRAGAMKYDIGDRFSTEMSRAKGLPPWKVDGYFFGNDQQGKGQYGYRVSRGDERAVLRENHPDAKAWEKMTGPTGVVGGEPALQKGAAPPGASSPSPPGEPEGDKPGGQGWFSRIANYFSDKFPDSKKIFTLIKGLEGRFYNSLLNESAQRWIAMRQIMYRLPKDITKDQWERMFHAGEILDNKNLTPAEVKEFTKANGGPLTAREQEVFDKWVQPMRKGGTQFYNWLTGKGVDVGGYMHRIRQGKGAVYDRLTDPAAEADFNPIYQGPGNRALSTKTPSQIPRQFFIGQRADGTKELLQGDKFKVGDQYNSEKGGTGIIKREALTREIEAGTGIKFYKHAFVNTADNYLRLDRAWRNQNFLDGLKDQTRTEGLSFGRDEKAPQGFRSTIIPQLQGEKFHPRVARVLDLLYRVGPQNSLDAALAPLNKFLVGSIFINPVSAVFGHGANVVVHWYVGRGWDNFLPNTWGASGANFMRAVHEVTTLGPDYQRVMRVSSGLLYGKTVNPLHATTDTMVKLMGGEMLKNPGEWEKIAKAAGTSPAHIVKALSGISSKWLWNTNDVFLLQRIYDLEGKGMPLEDAVTQAEHEIPNYIIPAEAWNGEAGRVFADFMRNSQLLIFGRYRYGMIHAMAHTIGNLAGKDRTGAERMHAAGQLVALGTLFGVLYPVADQIAKAITNNPNAYMRRAGPAAPLNGVLQWANKGKPVGDDSADVKNLFDSISGLFAPAPGSKDLLQLLTNTDFFTRKPLIPWSGGDPGWIAYKLGDYAVTAPLPGQQIDEMMEGRKNWPEVVANMIGIQAPTAEELANRERYHEKDILSERKADMRDLARKTQSLGRIGHELGINP